MRVSVLQDSFFKILEAVPNTLLMALIIMVFGIILGTVIALIRIRKVKVLSGILTVFVAYIRGTPMIVQLFITYYSLPYLLSDLANKLLGMSLRPFDIPNLVTIYFCYILYAAGYQSETMRGALSSVESGQIEAAKSIGMTSGQSMKRVIFPQAMAVAIPSFFTYYLSTIKMLSLAFTLQVVDILAATKLYSALAERYSEPYISTAIIYWLISIVLTFVFNKMEQYFSKGKAQALKM